MSITFTFADVADLTRWKECPPVPTYFKLPDEAWQLADCREHVLAVAQCVGQLTQALLYLSSKQLTLKRYPIKTESPPLGCWQVMSCINYILLRFERRHFHYTDSDELKIVMPISPPISSDYYRVRGYLSTSELSTTEEQKAYARLIETIAQHCLVLLNAEPIKKPEISLWKFIGFHPHWLEYSAMTRFNKRSRASRAEERRQEREEQKRKAREEKLAQKRAAALERKPSTVMPITGAGRRVGAVPGMFKGVMFRSQLEIRFVTQLEAKGVRWIYEGERLGEGQYLVDFYLPDLAAWVEVKGRVEPRDDYLLKDVADYLKRERQERLFIFAQSKAYRVSASAFTPMTLSELWQALERL